MDLIPRLLWRPGSVVNLAVLRIALCVSVFGPAAHYAIAGGPSLDGLPTIAPTILGHVLLVLPRELIFLRVVAGALAVSCIAGALGYRTRWAMPALAVLLAYHTGVPQIFGKVDHNHHVLWIAFILAFSHCGDALSLDSRGRRPTPAIRYGFPLRAVWASIGLAYFFAGFWKVGSIGLEWMTSRNLRGIMWDERIARGESFEPLLDVAGSNVLLTVGAVFTVAFELGFVFLVFHPRTRPVAVLAGIAFHISTGFTMAIWFTGLMIFYVAFIDWERVLARVGLSPDRVHGDPPIRPASANNPSRVSIGAVGLLLCGIVLAGFAREIDGWPVASYPDFGYRSPEMKVTAELRGIDSALRSDVFDGLGEIARHRLLLRVALTDDGRAQLVELMQSSRACEGSANALLVTKKWSVDQTGLTELSESAQRVQIKCDREPA